MHDEHLEMFDDTINIVVFLRSTIIDEKFLDILLFSRGEEKKKKCCRYRNEKIILLPEVVL